MIHLVGLFIFLLCHQSFAATWKNEPLVYGVSPYFLAKGKNIKGLEAIRRRLPEIQDLGANILWLQPITVPAAEGHGYDVIDFRKIWPALGTENDLRNLVRETHRRGLKIMLDVVLNHSSDQHPFVKDIISHGKKSPFYDFYQHENIAGIGYNQHFNHRLLGNETFYYYFWEPLLNFNYKNQQLREYLYGTLEYWVQEFGIDGFRFDASWGPSSRHANFYREVSMRLRKINPEIILMAEDKAGYPAAYENIDHPHLKNSGFDWAYDWNNQDSDWLSRWSFNLDPETNEDIFNTNSPTKAADHFIEAVRFTQHASVKPLRYLENNDTVGLLKNHTLTQVKWAATVMMLLPGVPLIFYGQESGNDHELFSLPSFEPDLPISARNPGLHCFYKKLIHYRQNSKPLARGSLTNLRKTEAGHVSFVRRFKNKKVTVDFDFTKRRVQIDWKNLDFSCASKDLRKK